MNTLASCFAALTLTLQVLIKISSNFFHLPLAALAAGIVTSFRK